MALPSIWFQVPLALTVFLPVLWCFLSLLSVMYITISSVSDVLYCTCYVSIKKNSRKTNVFGLIIELSPQGASEKTIKTFVLIVRSSLVL